MCLVKGVSVCDMWYFCVCGMRVWYVCVCGMCVFVVCVLKTNFSTTHTFKLDFNRKKIFGFAKNFQFYFTKTGNALKYLEIL